MTLMTPHLLSTCPTFESSIQESSQNPFYALELLSQLADITHKSLESVRKSALTPKSAPKSTPLTAASARKSSAQERAQAQNLLDALQAAKRSGRSFRTTAPHCTTILKAPPK